MGYIAFKITTKKNPNLLVIYPLKGEPKKNNDHISHQTHSLTGSWIWTRFPFQGGRGPLNCELSRLQKNSFFFFMVTLERLESLRFCYLIGFAEKRASFFPFFLGVFNFSYLLHLLRLFLQNLMLLEGNLVFMIRNPGFFN